MNNLDQDQNFEQDEISNSVIQQKEELPKHSPKRWRGIRKLYKMITITSILSFLCIFTAAMFFYVKTFNERSTIENSLRIIMPNDIKIVKYSEDSQALSDRNEEYMYTKIWISKQDVQIIKDRLSYSPDYSVDSDSSKETSIPNTEIRSKNIGWWDLRIDDIICAYSFNAKDGLCWVDNKLIRGMEGITHIYITSDTNGNNYLYLDQTGMVFKDKNMHLN